MICFRLLDSKDPAQPLADAVQALAQNKASQDTYEVEPTSFRHIPNAPFAYWVSDKTRRLFTSHPALQNEARTAKQGLASGDDFRFVRTAWESPLTSSESTCRRWFHFAKGGSYSPYYADIFLKVNWGKSGEEIRFLGDPNGSKPLSRPQSTSYYFRCGLTWPRRTQSGLALRAMPRHCVFADKGPAIFNERSSHQNLTSLLALTSSTSFKSLVALQMAFGSYEVGVIQRTVIPKENDERLPGLAKHAWSKKRMPDTANLTSHAFVAPALSPRTHTF